jgi:hypothetical protein
MAKTIVPRTLTATLPGEKRQVDDDALITLGFPLVLLGDPGMGKTELMGKLAVQLGTERISAGAFVRNAKPEKLPRPPFVIDGLDELAASTGASAVDEVLKKLSALDTPQFVLSCRAMDWQGSADRQKILEDYGTAPITLQLEPLSRDDAKAILANWKGIDPEGLLKALEAQGLSDFYKNPLTLNLTAEIAATGEGLPSGRADLLTRASEILCFEDNEQHAQTPAAKASTAAMLDSAGAAFAHILLTGSVGVADRTPRDTPDGFLCQSDLQGLPNAPLVNEALRTRLFQSSGEKLFTPYHRVIAEFLAARWLGNRFNAGLSGRRIEQLLTYSKGIPTSLRGLHAWYGYFAPRVKQRCIQLDPYGMLRYGDPDKLSVPDAKYLLTQLAALAEEDPYFRSEDWSRQAVASIVRPELRGEILTLLKSPDRPVHLSTVILESLPGTALADEIAPELEALVLDTSAPYVERSNAVDVLVEGKAKIDWPRVIATLNRGAVSDNRRLAIETMGEAGVEGLPAAEIVRTFIFHYRILDNEADGPTVSGVDIRLVRDMAPATAAQVLDGLTLHIDKNKKERYWRVTNSTARMMLRLVNRALGGARPEPGRLWGWLRWLPQNNGLNDTEAKQLQDYLIAAPEYRHAIQLAAIYSGGTEEAFMAAVSYLPQASAALRIVQDDVLVFMDSLRQKPNLSEIDVEFWKALVRLCRSEAGVDEGIRDAAIASVATHPQLEKIWDELNRPMDTSWKQQEEQRAQKAKREKDARFAAYRRKLQPLKADIEQGKAFNHLHNFAGVYLGPTMEFDENASGTERLTEWLGEELARAALRGFVSLLSRADLPNAAAVAANHAKGSTFNGEGPMVCGAIEYARQGGDYHDLKPDLIAAILAAWWEWPDHYDKVAGDEIRPALEAVLFTSPDATKAFLSTQIEPMLAAGSEHVQGLYQLTHDPRYLPVAGDLAIAWLQNHPSASVRAQRDLIEIADRCGRRGELKDIAEQRVKAGFSDKELEAIWMGALFLSSFTAHVGVLAAYAQQAKDRLWVFAAASRPERDEKWLPLSIEQLEFLTMQFAPQWPPAFHPVGGWSGSQNPWDASNFIRAAVNSIGANSSEDAAASLDRMAASAATTQYHDHIRHIRAQQSKLRRDTVYQPGSVTDVRATLTAGAPTTIDDLKAATLDALWTTQKYLRDGDTSAWKPFSPGGKPLTENECRDRLLDILRPNLPAPVQASPEMTMPDAKRADIAVTHDALGLPVEIKGQWHKDIWTAPSTQLIDKYTKDYRAKGRGLYLVLWFGPNKHKPLTKNDALAHPPQTPSEMRDILLAGLPKVMEASVDVFVLDLSLTV